MSEAPGRAEGPAIVVDLQALQSPTTRSRGIGRYVMSLVGAIERADPTAITVYALNPDLPPPGRLDLILDAKKVAYARELDPTGFDIWHSCSAFDPAAPPTSLPATQILSSGCRLSFLIYDLIPARDPAAELADPIARRRYRTQLELVRTADALLADSVVAASDLTSVAGIDPLRTFVIGGGADESFEPPADRGIASSEAIALLDSLGLHGPFVLGASGSHPRKNNERLIAAFLALPRAREGDVQLVLTGEIDEPTANHYRYLAREAGIDDAVIVAGHVPDETLVALTKGAALACVPSLAEGFGLNVAEAIACRTPVVCSDRPPFDELVASAARFDPTDISSITAALRSGLEQPEEILAAQLDAPNWSDIAKLAIEAFGVATSRPPRWESRYRSGRRRRTRVAFVTPLPPAPSGVAGYSYALLDAIGRTDKAEIDVFVEELTSDTVGPPGITLRPVQSLSHVERLSGPYDSVIYTVGNSHHHLGALSFLRRRRGIVIAHDVRLSNLYRHAHGDPSMLPGGFENALHEMYPAGLPDGLGHQGELSASDQSSYGALMAREIVRLAEAFCVSSESAANLARLDAGPLASGRIVVLPFALSGGAQAPEFLEEPRREPDGIAALSNCSWGADSPPESASLLAHFGIVDESKRPFVLLEALGALRASGSSALLAFVGPVSDQLAAAIATRASELALQDFVILTGPLPRPAYERWLSAATIAVQLRAHSNGEASAAIGECLVRGLPTVVSDIGWAGELPSDAVEKLSPVADPEALSTRLQALLDDPSRRRRIGDAARQFAATQTFDRSARTLLALVEQMRVVTENAS